MPNKPAIRKTKARRREHIKPDYKKLLRSRKYKLVFVESNALTKSGFRITKSGEKKLIHNVEPSVQRRLMKVDTLESKFHVISREHVVRVADKNGVLRRRKVKVYKFIPPELSIMGFKVPSDMFQTRRPDSVKHITIPKGEARTITYGLQLPMLKATPNQRQLTGLDKAEYFSYGANDIPSEDRELVDFLGEALQWLLKKYPDTLLTNVTIYYRPYDGMGVPMLVNGEQIISISGRLKRDPADAIMETLRKIGGKIGENQGVSGMYGGLVRVVFNLVERLKESQQLNLAVMESLTGTEKWQMEQYK
jgi:hypothetical protein